MPIYMVNLILEKGKTRPQLPPPLLPSGFATAWCRHVVIIMTWLTITVIDLVERNVGQYSWYVVYQYLVHYPLTQLAITVIELISRIIARQADLLAISI